MAFMLRCPDCRGKFAWQPSAKTPRFCPLCSADMGEEADDSVICVPSFISAKTKNTDKVYRDTEKGSETRAELAASMAGVPVSEMSSLKITDMNDRKDSQYALKDVVNPVTQFMQQTGVGGFRGADGAGYSGAVQTGPAPNAGAKMRTVLQNQHAQFTGGAGVSDRPALETLQPGYRRRG